MNDSQIQRRKTAHIDLAQGDQAQINGGFDDVYLPYRALPEIDLSQVSTEVELLGKTLSQPLIIASMTGGTKHAAEINLNLAIAAQECRVALGVGSQRIALEQPEVESSFKLVRGHAPDAVLFANMAAVQLNYGYNVDHYRKIVDMIKADGLYLHLNPLQEALQPGGNTDFAGLLDKIRDLVERVEVPVFVKEVGHGIDLESARMLLDCKLAGLDVAGSSGTSWAWIEATRDGKTDSATWFKEVGVPTPQAIREIAEYYPDVTLVASGGVRSPIDGLKSHLLGADYYSAAVPFLKPALTSSETIVDTIEEWRRGLQVGMFSMGATNWKEVVNFRGRSSEK